MRGPTHKQLLVLAFVRAEVEAHGSAPTMREIGAHMGIASTNGVNDHLRALERKGWLARRPGRARALALTPAGAALLEARSAVQVDAHEDGELACAVVVHRVIQGGDCPVCGVLACVMPVNGSEPGETYCGECGHRGGPRLALADLRALLVAPLPVARVRDGLLLRAIAVLERLALSSPGPRGGGGRG